jgi:hypothetical protein
MDKAAAARKAQDDAGRKAAADAAKATEVKK